MNQDMKHRVVIVSNRLPISITENLGKLTLQRSNGGLATAMSSVMKQYDALWIGWPGAVRPKWRQQLTKLRIDRRLVPLHIPATQLKKYYERISNGVLWPMLHGFGAAIEYTADDWDAYVAVNKRFAQSLKQQYTPNDTIWIHDYHLLLVPQMLRDMGINNRIGFFLHTPFAAPDCLDGLTARDDVLRSLAQVDVLGFQTERDSNNFLHIAQAAGISLRQGIKVEAFPIGVDFDAYQASTRLIAVKREVARIRPTIKGKRVILSVSRLDYTKGILEQLKAFERILADTSKSSKLLYKIIVAPSREDAAGYRELKEQIEQTVERINSAYGKQGYEPIDFTYRNCGFEEVSAWYSLADILLVTPRIDGMNLVVKEYVAARQNDRGVLVLSNTIGAAKQLRDAILVPPRKVSAIAEGLLDALGMPIAERSRRWRALQRNVQTEDIFWWVKSFLGALESQPRAPRGQAAKQKLQKKLSSLRAMGMGKLHRQEQPKNML